MLSYSELLKIIETKINENPFLGEPQNLYDPVNYIITLGGKRIRPVLALMGSQLFSDNYEKALPSAMALEIFHNFSLIHDDIMDKAPLRRGKQTVHEKWDLPTAILSGDLMLVKANEALLKSDQKYWRTLLPIFNKTAAEVCEGQQMDMNFESRSDVTEDDYLKMIRLKTSVLLGCSLYLGAMVSDASLIDAELLYSFGVNAGMGFQLMDDYLDAFGTPELVGKQPGGDILSEKKTLLYLHAFQEAGPDFKRVITDKTLDDAVRIETVKSIFLSTGADSYAKEISFDYFSRAQQNLTDVHVDGSRKVELEKLLVNLQTRSF